MHCYFLLNVKHGASQLYWGGGSNYLAPALGSRSECRTAPDGRRPLDHGLGPPLGSYETISTIVIIIIASLLLH